MPAGGFVWKGKTLLSGIDPAGRAERTAGAIALKDRTLYLCPSPLYGYGLDRLLARLAVEAPNSGVLCVEADPELYDLSIKNIDTALAGHPNLRITNASEPGALCALARQTWGSRSFRRVEIVRFSGGWQLFPELYNRLAEALRREIAVGWGNALTLARLGRRYIRNALQNLTFLPVCPPITERSFGAAPALVLGAGPSLDPLLESLSRYFGESLYGAPEKTGPKTRARPFKIICVDTCLPALRDRNIFPDLAVILESQHWNLRDFTGLKGWEVPAAMDLSALPASARVLAGGLCLFMTPWTDLRVFGRLKTAGLLPPEVLPLGSVGLCAVEIARRLTRGNIITGGLDFSFSPDAYHARSTPGHKDKLQSCSRFKSLLNAAAAFGGGAFCAVSKDGKQVRGSPAMRNYRALFEQEFAGDSRLFDIADSGLPLGIKTLSMDDAVKLLEAGAAGTDTANTDAAIESGFAHNEGRERPPAEQAVLREKLRLFLQDEKERLVMLRAMLTGEAAAEGIDILIDECDYLWAHFPDYAGAGGRRPGGQEIAAASPAALSFLKRIRAELDPALSLIEQALSREAQDKSS
jgi:hypothetical protein